MTKYVVVVCSFFALCFGLGTRPAEASSMESCTYDAKVVSIDGKPIPRGNKRRTFLLPVSLEVTSLVRAGGHHPVSCRRSNVVGTTIQIKMSLERLHFQKFFKKGSTIKVHYRRVFNFIRRRMRVWTTWRYIPPKKLSYSELVGIDGPSALLPDHVQAGKELSAITTAIQGKTLTYNLKGTMRLRCRRSRCDAKASHRYMSFETRHLRLFFMFHGKVIKAKTSAELRDALRMILPTFKRSLGLKGWKLRFGSHHAYIVKNSPKLQSMELKNNRLVASFRFDINWLSARKQADPYCKPPNGHPMPKPCLISQKLNTTVQVKLSLAIDRKVVDCTKTPSPKACT